MKITRPKDVPRIAVGTRVSYTMGKWWWETGYGYVLQPQNEWCKPRMGTVVPPENHSGWERGPDHPWGMKDFWTLVTFDDADGRYEAIPTSMLDVCEEKTKDANPTQLELF